MEGSTYPTVDQALLDEYVAQMSDLDRIAMRIAEEELKSSFSLEKSVGFLKWMAERG